MSVPGIWDHICIDKQDGMPIWTCFSPGLMGSGEVFALDMTFRGFLIESARISSVWREDSLMFYTCLV